MGEDRLSRKLMPRAASADVIADVDELRRTRPEHTANVRRYKAGRTGRRARSAATESRTAAVVIVAAVALALGIMFSTVRLLTACEGAVGCFALAGQEFTNADETDVPVFERSGYDGQFFLRQAQAPLDFAAEERHGVRFDNPMRPSRVGYPATAWVLALGGHRTLVPWALPLLGLLSVAGIAGIAAATARRAGHSPWWGLAVAGTPGLVFAVSRDLADPFSALLAGATAFCLTRRRWGWASVFAVGAVVTKEQAVLLPLAYAFGSWFEMLRDRRRRLVASDLPWVTAGIAFVVWQLTAYLLSGTFAAGSSSATHVVFPGTEVGRALVDWLSPSSPFEAIWALELALIVALSVVAIASEASELWERLVAAATIGLLAVLSINVWVDPAHFRQVSDLVLVSALAAMRGRRRAWMVIVVAHCALSLPVAARFVLAP